MSESTPSESIGKIIVHEDIQPRTNQADDIASILLQESTLHAPKYGERLFRNIVYDLMKVVENKKMNLRLDDGAHSYRIAFEGPDEISTDDMLPMLHIRNKNAFMHEVARAQKMIGPGNGNGEWAYGQKIMDLWCNAAPDDFEHPENFLQQQIYALEHPLFNTLETETWKKVGTLKGPDLEVPFLIRNAGTHPDTESAYELQFRAGDDEADDLPSVRYAKISPDTVIVYAVQMPFIEGDSERSTEDKLQKRIGDSRKLEEKKEKFHKRKQKLGRFNRFLGRRIENSKREEIGHIPDDLAGTPPNALISMTAAVELFRQQGVKHIKIPTYLPWRQHMDRADFVDPEGAIDKRILEQTTRLARRVAFEVEGTKVVSFGEGDHYMHLTLGENLESIRPLLSQVLTLVKEDEKEENI